MNKGIRPRDNQRNQNPNNNLSQREATGQNQNPDENKSSYPKLWTFKILYLLSQLIGIIIIILIIFWIYYYLGGFSWRSNPKREFNWHPLLMNLGMIYLYSNSILIFRVFRRANRKKLKLWHTSLHASTFILVAVGFTTVFDSHNLVVPPMSNGYSLHSWIGWASVSLFACQWVTGLIFFLIPGVTFINRAAMMPYHIFFGLCGFILAIAALLLGLIEITFFSLTILEYTQLPAEALIINCIGILNVIFGALVIYIVTKPEYKRTPFLRTYVIPTGNNA